jgi:hypothetical protein
MAIWLSVFTKRRFKRSKRVSRGAQSSPRRIQLFRQLLAYVAELATLPIAGTIIVDGSFVMTSVKEPNDIDLLLTFPKGTDFVWQFSRKERRLISRRRVSARYDIDIIVARESSAAQRMAISLFGDVNPKWRQQLHWPLTTKKGIVRIVS